MEGGQIGCGTLRGRAGQWGRAVVQEYRSGDDGVFLSTSDQDTATASHLQAPPSFLSSSPGELHAFHPTVQQLRGFVAQQRAAAEAVQAEREGGDGGGGTEGGKGGRGCQTWDGRLGGGGAPETGMSGMDSLGSRWECNLCIPYQLRFFCSASPPLFTL